MYWFRLLSWLIFNCFIVNNGNISIASFATVIGAPVGIASASFSLPFSFSTGIVKKLVKTTRNKEKKHNKIITLSRSKLNRIESKTSVTLINNEIRHEDFMTIISKEKSYRELKERIRMMNNQRSDSEKIIWLKKVLAIDEIIKCNEIINDSLKSKI